MTRRRPRPPAATRPVDEGAGPLLARLHGQYRLAILSNWPLAWAIDAIAERAGWTPYLDVVVVSERVGWVKPHPAIFAATTAARGPRISSRVQRRARSRARYPTGPSRRISSCAISSRSRITSPGWRIGADDAPARPPRRDGPS